MGGNTVYLYVTPFFPSPTSWRGSYCLDFVKALERTGKYDVKVFLPGSGTDYEIEGVKVYRFPTKQLPSNILPFLFRRYNERSFLNKVKRVLQTLTAVKVCHAHTANCAIYALAAKREFGCQALLHHHDPQSFGLNLGVLRHCALYNTWLFCRMRKLFEQIDCHIFISEMVKRSFLSAPDASWTIYEDYKRQMRGPAFFHCRPVRIKRSLILHNGVDTSIFHPIPTNHEPRDTNRVFTIGCIGNFIDWKDQATLIRAVGLLVEKSSTLHLHLPPTPIKVVFVGSGPTLESCKRLAADIESRINKSTTSSLFTLHFSFEKEVSHSQLADFYRSLDLFVLPSYFEGFGCVFTEAYACGVPFITCEGQGIEDLFPESERELWLCRQLAVDDLARMIGNYVTNRPKQHLSSPITFAEFVPNFLRELEQ